MNKFNLNHYVYVKLNDKGKQILNESPIYCKYNNQPDEEGFYKFQMWHFMKLFSPHLHMGMDVVTEENCLYIKDEDFL